MESGEVELAGIQLELHRLPKFVRFLRLREEAAILLLGAVEQRLVGLLVVALLLLLRYKRARQDG